MTDVLLLHPGEMGSSVGNALVFKGHGAYWISEGRSESTRLRARKASMFSEETLKAGLAKVEIVISVCPPEFAVEVADQVLEHKFKGIYCDANAVAPSTAQLIAEKFGNAYVDGGIIGPPLYRHGTTRLYVSGANAVEIVNLFAGSALDTRLVEGDVVSASALKMCYAAYTKGSSAMLLAIRSLADAHGITSTLKNEWELSQPRLWERSEGSGPGTTRKAWRFAPEMREIAKTFENSGLPSGFHDAASDVYQRMAILKDSEPVSTRKIAKLLRED
ncbi:MAG: DUF1932 domain-containing protein [Gammaproteobacteria bacterium]|nr:DUF1932 domain-containing protein [Gammaproteobacteria bacterium]